MLFVAGQIAMNHFTTLGVGWWLLLFFVVAALLIQFVEVAPFE